MKMKHGVLTATVALLMGGAGVSQAAMLLDPDGLSNVNGGINLAPIEIEQLDWNQGATLAQGGNQAIANFLNGSGPTDFWVYSHATLAVGNGPGGITLTPSTADGVVGSNTVVNGEYTAVLGFKEKVTSVTTTGGGGLATAVFDLVPTTEAFFAVFFDSASNANDLTGDGYTDGTKVLELGVQATAGGTFSVNTTAGTVNLDQSTDGDGWNGKQTVTGSGSQQDITLELSAASDPDVYINPDFILNGLVEAMFLNIDLTLPFNGQFNPSYAFNTSTGTAGTADHIVCDPAGTCTGTNTLGTVNGGLTSDPTGTWVVSGPDFMFSTDANSVWRGVPEPGVLALMGMGLAAFGWSSNRRKPQAA